MYRKDQTTFQLPDLQDHTLLMLCWRSFSEWGREHVAFSIAYKGGQYLIYEWLQPVANKITQHAGPKTIDAPLTLILPRLYLQHYIIVSGIVNH